jgi:hypothetical protein
MDYNIIATNEGRAKRPWCVVENAINFLVINIINRG